MENVQATSRRLFPCGNLLRGCNIVVVYLVDVGPEYLAAIHCSHHIAAWVRVAGRQARQQKGSPEHTSDLNYPEPFVQEAFSVPTRTMY